MHTKVTLNILLLVILFLQLTGCATTHHYHHRYTMANDGAPPPGSIDVSNVPDAVPKVEPLSKYGNPPSYDALGHRYYVMKSCKGYDERGIASWYGMKFSQFRTSSGEPYNMSAMTAAHKTLPLPTYVQVTNLQNGKQAIVKVNDRGPFVSNRIIDLSYAAAVRLGVYAHGTALVEVKAIDPTHPESVVSQVPQAAVPGHPQLYLQVGAFSVRSNADRLVPQVKQWTQYPVIVKEVQINGRTICRVQIGPLPNVDISDDLYDHLEKAGLGKPHTVVE